MLICPLDVEFYCMCGCGMEVNFGKKFIRGHHGRGKSCSEEVKLKISCSNTGKTHSEETKAKMSLLRRGDKNPNFGNHHSDAAKEKISFARRGEKNPNFGKDFSGERGLFFGRHHSEETKAKMSFAKSGENNPNFGKIFSEETKKKMSLGNIGKIRSEETRTKMSITRSGEGSPMFGRYGEKNPNWHGGINSISYGPGDTEELKEQIRIRDKHTCQECGRVWDGTEKKFDPHHIDYDKNNHVSWNRINLCRSCHSITGHNRSYWTKHLYDKNFKNCIKRIMVN